MRLICVNRAQDSEAVNDVIKRPTMYTDKRIDLCQFWNEISKNIGVRREEAIIEFKAAIRVLKIERAWQLLFVAVGTPCRSIREP